MTTLYDEKEASGIDGAPSSLMAEPSSAGVGMAPGETGAMDQGMFVSPQAGGLGLSPSAQPQPSTMQKVGDALYNFGAGMEGRPLMGHIRGEEQRKQKLMKIAEVKETASALEHGVTLAQGMEGDARDKFVETYASTLDGMDKGLGATFKAVADRPDVMKNIASIMPYMPEPLQIQAKLDPKAFIKTLGTEAGIKALDHAKSQYSLRTATNKAQMILTHAQQLGIPDELVKEYQANQTASVFLKMERASTDPRVKLSPDEQSAVASNADVFYGPLGMMTPKGEEAIREDAAKKKTSSASDQAKLAEDTRHHKAEEAAAQARLDQDKFSAPVEVSIDGKNTMVRQDKKTGKLLDPNGVDVTDKIAPQIKGAPLDPGRISMALQAHKDITDARAMIFDKDGNLNRSVIAAMDVPGTKGVGTQGRKAYSAIENAVAAKLRGETGAATNPGEIENTAARFRPTLMDSAESAKYKIDRLQEFMGMTLDQLKESYHISQETYDKAKGGSRGDRASEPQAMPADKSALVPNQDYITSRGVATWNGTEFVVKKKK